MRALLSLTPALLTMPLLSACDGPDKPADTGTLTDEPDCAEAEARLGYRACVPRVADEATFQGVTVASSSVDQLRVGKYMVPAVDGARLPPVFVDVNRFQLHYDFLINAFPDDFAGLSIDQYEDLVLRPDTREFYAGTVSLYIDADSFFYGFTVWDDPADPATTVTEAQVGAAWTQLQERFNIGDLAFVPNSTDQQAAVPGWGDTDFPVRNPAEVDYEGYTVAEGYGYLRLYTLDEFADAGDVAAYGYQDIVVIEEAPEDLVRVVSGIVTGTRQGTLSHLNVRSGARGTPNCYLRDPLPTLAAWEDQLVRFSCGQTDWDIAAATVEEATAAWAAMRPEPAEICAPVLDDLVMLNLLDADTSTAEARAVNLCTYGAKSANLATLYSFIDPQYQLEGFMLPFSLYDQFARTATWDTDPGGGVATMTFYETLDAWHSDPAFLTDAAVRSARLAALRDAMMAAPVDPAVLAAIGAHIITTWGGDTTMVRLRSSSNAEDGAGFSGAGLYESASVCLADEYDGDTNGPSRCDATEPDEKTVSDGLREVWASLWGLAAWEERDWYGIDHLQVVMGVLCDTRYNDEIANVVAFSGNPTSAADTRYLINAQLGDLEVVSAEPGVYPEKILLTVDSGGVQQIDRVSASSEGVEVLSDAQLSTLGAVFYDIARQYPVDEPPPEGGTLLWDTEWKFLSDGSLVIKQIRPYVVY